jgi:thiamine transporter
VLDYPLAFGLLGVAGFFQNRPYVGIALGMVGRFFAHFISGIVYFPEFAPAGVPVAVYSAWYNGSYLLVEFVVTVYIIYLLRKNKMLNIYI